MPRDAAHEQIDYQVRFDWGVSGARAIGEGLDVVVWVDEVGGAGAAADVAALPAGAAVIMADLRTSQAAARWVMDLQLALGTRLGIGVVAAGSVRADGTFRADVEDLLAAGAVVDALAALGIDASSPEAAAAEAAHRALARAVGHLVSASVSGRRAATPPAVHRVDGALGPEAVTVLRPHPDSTA